jgi:ABC-type multidrug transport system fused ATPase/permease subunit
MRDLLFIVRLTPGAIQRAGAASALLATRSLLGLAEPLVLMLVINAITSGRVGLAMGGGFGLLLIRLLSAGLGIIARESLSYASQRLALSVRDRVYRHIQALPPPALLPDGRAGRLWLVTGDVATLETLFSDVFVRLVGIVIGVLGAIVALVLLEPRIAVVTVIITAGVAILVARRYPAISECATAARNTRAALFREIETRLSAMETIQLARRERVDAALVRGAGVRVARSEFQSVRAQARVWGLAELLSGALQGGVVLVGGHLAIIGVLSLGALLATYLYAGQLLETVSQGAQMLGRLQTALVGARRVRALLGERPAVIGGKLQPAAPGAASLHLENVTFGYDGTSPVLNRVTFTLRAGEHVALIGPSGSGKTTLVRLLARLVDPLAGRICLDAVDVRDLDLVALRRSVIVLPQTVALLRGTLADNICFSPEWRRCSAIDAARRAGLDEDLRHTLSTRTLGDDGATLSGGQRQRVALARLFVEQPRLLVLDEPTAALDDSTADVVWTSLRRHARDCTMLAITHDLRLARCFPRVLVLDAGCLVADGPPEAVLTTAQEHALRLGHDARHADRRSWLTTQQSSL